jgi:hypothetical protein
MKDSSGSLRLAWLTSVREVMRGSRWTQLARASLEFRNLSSSQASLGDLVVGVDHPAGTAGQADEVLAVEAAAGLAGRDQRPADGLVAVLHRGQAAVGVDDAAPEVVALEQHRDLVVGELGEGAVAAVGAELELGVAQALAVELGVEAEDGLGLGGVAEPLAAVDEVLAGAVQQGDEPLGGGGLAHGRARVDLQRGHAGEPGLQLTAA